DCGCFRCRTFWSRSAGKASDALQGCFTGSAQNESSPSRLAAYLAATGGQEKTTTIDGARSNAPALSARGVAASLPLAGRIAMASPPAQPSRADRSIQ
ncbi:unnamed protein product, partial [Polarella glacialis]